MKIEGGAARKENNLCEACFMHAESQQKKRVDEHMDETVIINEFE
jgi:hypothetical protein